MSVSILYFGKLREIAGRDREDAAPPEGTDTTDALIAWLAARNPDLGAALAQPSVRIAVDHEIASGPRTSVAGAREIAFMPPMSGG